MEAEDDFNSKECDSHKLRMKRKREDLFELDTDYSYCDEAQNLIKKMKIDDDSDQEIEVELHQYNDPHK